MLASFCQDQFIHYQFSGNIKYLLCQQLRIDSHVERYPLKKVTLKGLVITTGFYFTSELSYLDIFET